MTLLFLVLCALLGWYWSDMLALARSGQHARIEEVCSIEGRAMWLVNGGPVCMDVLTGALFAPRIYRPAP